MARLADLAYSLIDEGHMWFGRGETVVRRRGVSLERHMSCLRRERLGDGDCCALSATQKTEPSATATASQKGPPLAPLYSLAPVARNFDDRF